ncbi:MAG: IS66 family insertion sequence element accessory protein TnpB [Albidovulum sp.]|nr:IS66 family insertion sequence element accessory protein TnpB [Albidovulum sp.]
MPANVPESGIWLSARPADMRKSLDGLAAPVRNELGGDVVSGGWFVFDDRRRKCYARLRVAGPKKISGIR